MKRSEDKWWRLRSRPPLQEFNLGQPMLFSFSYGLIHRWTSLVHTVPGVEEPFQPLEEEIQHHGPNFYLH